MQAPGSSVVAEKVRVSTQPIEGGRQTSTPAMTAATQCWGEVKRCDMHGSLGSGVRADLSQEAALIKA